MTLTKHEAQHQPRKTPMGELEYLITLWEKVCYEQERNNYDWEKTKASLLSDWRQEDMTQDFWMAYMYESILWAAKDVVHQSKEGK